MHADALRTVTVAGWLGQACFFSRFLVQWWQSERAGRSLVPPSFWWLSLAGAVLMSAYVLSRGPTLLLAGFLVSGGIAARNLSLSRARTFLGARRTALLAALAVAASLALELGRGHGSEPVSWLLLGTTGQVLWVARFPLQWFLSERARLSHFPPAFWWLSLAGNALLLAYALHLGDLLLVLGFLPGPLLQARNLVLSRGDAVPA